MIRYFLSLGLLLLTASCTTVAYSPYLSRKDPPDQGLYAKADLKRGGQLYDDWYEIRTLVYEPGKGKKTKYPPVRIENPILAGSLNPGALADSWRCKTCHGWDYRGIKLPAEGTRPALRVPDLLKAAQKPPLQLFSAIASGRSGHDFGLYLAEPELWSLVRFVREGTTDSRQLLSNNGKFKGDAVRGAAYYNSSCANCHGEDGNRLDFRSNKEGKQGLGWRSNGNPPLAWHRVSWGVWTYVSIRPKFRQFMPSARVDLGLTERQLQDVMAYIQTLGEK